MNKEAQPAAGWKRARRGLWLLVSLTIVATAATSLIVHFGSRDAQATPAPVSTGFGGPFTLVGSDGRPFRSTALAGTPYAIYFGFTRCSDVCPTTLSRLVKLRREAASDGAMRILFVTIDPAHDGPREVGQYSGLFDAPILGLTGTPAQIAQMKRQYGIYAEPVPNAPMGKEMAHTAMVLLFDRNGQFAGTISPDESEAGALQKLRALIG